MISNRMPVLLGGVLATCAVALTLWTGKVVRDLRTEVSAARAELSQARSESNAQYGDLRSRMMSQAGVASPASGAEAIPVDPLIGVEFKQARDMQKRVDLMVDGWRNQSKGEIAQIEELASLLTEIDEWLLVPEEQIEGDKILGREVALLRRLIKEQIAKLRDSAIDAEDGKAASARMAQINRLLSLYPVPSTATEQAALEQITAGILSTSRRVEEIRYLRYNNWAISQIEDSLRRYRSELSIGSVQDVTKFVRKDRDKLRVAAISTMGRIDTAFLNPAAMDLYSYAYSLYRDSMGADDFERARLAKGFADPTVTRLTPVDF